MTSPYTDSVAQRNQMYQNILENNLFLPDSFKAVIIQIIMLLSMVDTTLDVHAMVMLQYEVYVPMLELIPSETDPIKTTTVQAQELTTLTGQSWTLTIFKNDQELHKVAVHITWVDRDLFSKFISRLGGMLMLISFFESVGVLMAGSGLQELLQITSPGVLTMLNGKKFLQNVRPLRIVAEGILRPILEDHLHAGDWH